MIEMADIDLGDIVRLRNGETLAVGHISTSYIDAEGEHPGPWVSPRGAARDRYLVADLAEVVVRNPHRCKLCGGGVTAKEPERYPYCEGCYYGGRVEAHLRELQLDRFREALPGAQVAVDHTGGGCFWLGFAWPGEPDMYIATAGEATLPEDSDGKPLAEGGWGYVGRESVEGLHDGEVVTAPAFIFEAYWDEYPEHSMSDEAVIEAIRADRAKRGL